MKKIKFCPKYGSENIGFDPLSEGSVGTTNGKLREFCEDCNCGKFELGIFPIKDV